MLWYTNVRHNTRLKICILNYLYYWRAGRENSSSWYSFSYSKYHWVSIWQMDLKLKHNLQWLQTGLLTILLHVKKAQRHVSNPIFASWLFILKILPTFAVVATILLSDLCVLRQERRLWKSLCFVFIKVLFFKVFFAFNVAEEKRRQEKSWRDGG